MNDVDCTEMVSSYIGGLAAVLVHCRTVPSREAENMTFGDGKTTARTCNALESTMRQTAIIFSTYIVLMALERG